VPTDSETASGPKASRVRVWQAAERILTSGRRPTVAGVREILGGGSPNSVSAYLDDWYRDLGSRLSAAETPVPGIPADAVQLLAEIWRIASHGPAAHGEASDQLKEAERNALEADRKSLDVLNQELKRQRAMTEKALADTRALLNRREAALDEERSRALQLEHALAGMRLELEIALERIRLIRPKRSSRREDRARPSKPKRRIRKKAAVLSAKRPVPRPRRAPRQKRRR
jgi:Plasmid replication region DNA-binding N-term